LTDAELLLHVVTLAMDNYGELSSLTLHEMLDTGDVTEEEVARVQGLFPGYSFFDKED